MLIKKEDFIRNYIKLLNKELIKELDKHLPDEEFEGVMLERAREIFKNCK